ncbi:14364_t:CDS:2 [Dentiscutata erythropus]|uniref:14364_t:CDS:1 n=1 Tax=Dentiscutata erythropus TaxID=1348616 RepID=A0A9N9BAR5_9GLOM|nr:14364_t:CDS:2 [Dentiscutata erythropus]
MHYISALSLLDSIDFFSTFFWEEIFGPQAETFDELSDEDSSSCSEDSDHDDHDNEETYSSRTMTLYLEDLEENKVHERKQTTLHKLNNTWNISHAKEEVIEIIERYEDKNNTGGDIVISDTTAVYIRKSSQVKNEETKIDYLAQAIQTLPSDAIKREAILMSFLFFDKKVNLDYFKLLCIVGQEAFGKEECIKMDALNNVLWKQSILEELDHPLDCSDLRFHLNRKTFTEDVIQFG